VYPNLAVFNYVLSHLLVEMPLLWFIIPILSSINFKFNYRSLKNNLFSEQGMYLTKRGEYVFNKKKSSCGDGYARCHVAWSK
jgi:hypothetical protein